MSSIITNIIPQRNYIINGAFDFFQRQFAAVNFPATLQYVGPDRFLADLNSAWTVAPQLGPSVTLPTNSISENSLTFSGTPTATDAATNLQFEYRMESRDASNFVGKNGLFSFNFLASANAGASNDLVVTFSTPNVKNVFSAQTQFDTQTFNPPDDGTYYFYSYNLTSFPANIKNGLAIKFSWRNLATVAISGNLADVSLQEGRLFTGFRRAGNLIENELALCQRYYESSYDVTALPFTNTLVGALAEIGEVGNSVHFNVRYKVPKLFSVHSVTPISPVTGFINFIRDQSAAADVAAIIVQRGEMGSTIQSTLASVTGNLYTAHFIAESEL